MTQVFEDLNEAIKYFAIELNKQRPVVSKNDKNKKSYKKALGGELIQQFFTIKNSKKVLSTWNNHKFFKWWAYGEVLSEMLAYDPPIMYKYSTDLYDKHYDLLEDGRMQYTYANRFFEYSQFINIYRQLKDNPTSKRCCIVIYTPYDTDPNRKDVPCTTQYEFIIRNNKLYMTVMYRSWDFFGGFKTYDFVLSSFVQQMLASWLKVDLGDLSFYANSLHFYERDRKLMESLVDEVKDFDYKKSGEFVLDKQYDIEEFWIDLRKVKQVEEYAFAFNFKEAVKLTNTIRSVLFKDICLTFIKKNQKRRDDEI
jgi:thymidylate synthase